MPPEQLGEYLDDNCGDDAASKQYLLRLLSVEESDSVGLLAEGMDALTHYLSSIPNDDIQEGRTGTLEFDGGYGEVESGNETRADVRAAEGEEEMLRHATSDMK